MSVGQRLKKCRLKMKKTLKEQSEVLGVSMNSIYRWEHNLAMPRTMALKQLADMYEVPLEWLLHGRGMEQEPERDTDAVQIENDVEQQLLSMYRKLSNNNKYRVLGYVERIYVENMSEKACFRISMTVTDN